MVDRPVLDPRRRRRGRRSDRQRARRHARNAGRDPLAYPDRGGPWLRRQAQRFASAGVGDLYIVLTSPIQRAALSSAVQRDIDWLRDQGCERIAVVAHSQGGYVAYQALTEPWPRTVSLFITFGSG